MEGLLLFLMLTKFLKLLTPIKRLNKSTPLTPVFFNNHMQFKKHPRPQQRFDLLASIRPNTLQFASALADQNRLLSIALAIDRSRDARQRIFIARLRLFKTLNHHGRSIRNLFARLLQNALANQLGNEKPLRLIRVLVLREVALPRWQILDQLGHQAI